MTQDLELVLIQTSPSQLDAPFYKRLHELSKGRIKVIIWNDYGLVRKQVDPEMGVVPQFPVDENPYTVWIDKSQYGVLGLWLHIVRCRSNYVLLQDQSLLVRATLAVLLRLGGHRVGMRSDKNRLSSNANSGWKWYFERLFIRGLFDFFAPVSRLTSEYYGLTSRTCDFPYCTDVAKFSPTEAERSMTRSRIRARLGVDKEAKVVLAVIKLNERENPLLVLESFAQLNRSIRSAHLIVVGEGPLRRSVEERVDKLGLQNVSLPGYVRYASLHEYFFAADILVHLPKYGPWEVSVPDAIAAGLGVVASKPVGSAHICMVDAAQEFITDSSSPEAIAGLLEKLCSADPREFFRRAGEIVNSELSVEVVARRWCAMLERTDVDDASGI